MQWIFCRKLHRDVVPDTTSGKPKRRFVPRPISSGWISSHLLPAEIVVAGLCV